MGGRKLINPSSYHIKLKQLTIASQQQPLLLDSVDVCFENKKKYDKGIYFLRKEVFKFALKEVQRSSFLVNRRKELL